MSLRFRLGIMIMAICLVGGHAHAQKKPRIIAVNYPLQYFAERLAGETVDVIYPVPQGIDPSLWRPSLADIVAIQSADLILLNGAGFASWTAKVSLPRSRIVDTARGLENQFIEGPRTTHSHGPSGTHSHESIATYLWLDPKLALHQAGMVAEAIKAHGLADPEYVDVQMMALARDLQALDEAAHSAFQDVAGRAFIATHPRYQYLARAYDLRIESLDWEPGATPDAAQLADLEARIAKDNLGILIWETAPPPEAREAVTALGLTDIIFPPLAAPPPSGTFLDQFRAGIASIAAVIKP